MATRNRRDDAVRSVQQLAALPGRPPIVVVDNASRDGTAAAVGDSSPDATVVPLETNVGGCARNVGAEVATTAYLAFSDDDSWWAPGALERAATVLEAHPSVGLVMARILVGPQQRLDATCAAMAQAPLGRPAGMPYPRVAGFLACGAVVRRDAFLAAGGFHEAVRFPGEEEVLALDLRTAGWELVYVPDVVAHHHPRDSSDRAGRAGDMARSALVTSWLRQPAGVAARTTAGVAVRSLRSGDDRRALREALARWRLARRGRRVAPAAVRRELRDAARGRVR